MAWGSKTNATQLTSITTIQYFDVEVALDPGETAHVQVEVNFPTTPTDDAIVSVEGTLDDTSEEWDLTSYTELRTNRATDPNRVSFLVSGIYRFRVGVRRSGTTDTLTSADLSYRLNGIAL